MIFELRYAFGDDVLCLMCLDDGIAPDSTLLRRLAPFVELVEALGGRLNLWFARPGAGSRCLRQHGDWVACRGDEDTSRRIDDRRRHLRANRWYSHRAEAQHWLRVLDSALRMKGSATRAFALIPQRNQSEAR